MKSFNLDRTTYYFWLLTVFSSFWQTTDLALEIPVIGQLFLFRFFLPVTVCLFIANCIVKRNNPFKNLTTIQKCFFIVITVFVIYGAISLFWAIDFIVSFKALFNFSISLVYAVFAVLFIDNKKKMMGTFIVLLFSYISILAIGLIDVFIAPMFTTPYTTDRIYCFLGLPPLRCPFAAFYNTNDFVMALLYILPIILILFYFTTRVNNFKKWNPILFVTIFSTTYFLIKCSGTLLGEIAFWVIFVSAFIGIILFKRKLIFLFLCVLSFVFFICVGESYDWLIDDVSIPNNEQFEPSVSELNKFEKYFFAVDEQSGEKVLDTTATSYSGGVRVALIQFAFESFKSSKGLGVGIGNIEALASQQPSERFSGIINIHNAPMELLSEFGVIILLPLIPMIVLIVISMTKIIQKLYKQNNHYALLSYIALLSGCFAFPVLSTISSSGTDSLQMWIFVAILIVMVGSKPIIGIFVDDGLGVTDEETNGFIEP